MHQYGVNQLRKMFLEFFESKGHLAMKSFSLVPHNDKSLLLINSGMAPLKPYFTGQEIPPRRRVTTCQKCIRTGDIENVGKTARHGTFFEMLGNFSFGDYFKKEAIEWSWEFLTRVVGLDPDRLYPSVYEEDDEAFEIWNKQMGIPAERIFKFGKGDNFWEHGSGPCGPCSEIYFDRGPDKGCGSPDCHVGCDCDRFMEVWNLVFSQFDSDGAGNYTPMAHPNIDTGMGLERLACVMQGVDNLFEVDTVQNIMKHISRVAGVEYHQDHQKDISLRVITDHVRSTVMMIGDGVVPQNEGRGYVLRRLLRRAARHGRLLGIEKPFLYQVADTVIGENKTAYPELVQNRDYIVKVIRMEEDRFAKTIDAGLEQVNDIISALVEKGEKVFPGADAFRLYDTCGFPIDLTKEICAEKGLTVDEEGYKANMEEQRTRAREARKALGDLGWAEDALKELDITTRFVGYDKMESAATILAMVAGGELADSIGALSDGRYDVTVKPLVEAWGFAGRERAENPNVDSILEFVGREKVRVEGGRLVKDDPRVQLDFNSVAKGYTVDLLAGLVEKYGAENYIVDIGGEVRCRGLNRQGRAWCIGVETPFDGNMSDGEYLQKRIQMTGGGLATSGNYRRFYLDGEGNKVAHTIDPRTGRSALSRLLSVTVAAPTCAEADALGTMFLAMGADDALAAVERMPGVKAYFILAGDGGEYEEYVSPAMEALILK